MQIDYIPCWSNFTALPVQARLLKQNRVLCMSPYTVLQHVRKAHTVTCHSKQRTKQQMEGIPSCGIPEMQNFWLKAQRKGQTDIAELTTEELSAHSGTGGTV